MLMQDAPGWKTLSNEGVWRFGPGTGDRIFWLTFVDDRLVRVTRRIWYWVL